MLWCDCQAPRFQRRYRVFFAIINKIRNQCVINELINAFSKSKFKIFNCNTRIIIYRMTQRLKPIWVYCLIESCQYLYWNDIIKVTDCHIDVGTEMERKAIATISLLSHVAQLGTTRTPAFWGYPPTPHDYPILLTSLFWIPSPYYWPVDIRSQVKTRWKPKN